MKEHKEDLIKIILSSALLITLMIITHVVSMPAWAELILFAIPYLIIGWEVISEAAVNIIHGSVFDECFLMSVATLGAFVVGEYPEAVFVMLFFQVGELFEHIATAKSRRSVAELMDIRPDSANLETADGIISVPPEKVKKGDIIVIKPGEKIPLDGTVLSGTTTVNTTALTGESLPADIAPGGQVISGCINISGMIRVEVTSAFAESTVSKILQLVENSAANKAKSEAFITRFSRVYTPVVVGLAVLLAVVPSLIVGGFTTWLYRALMFLVVSCPCALVVSIPLTYFSGIGGASRNGILIKGANALEALAAVDTVVFDKTGTLTRGSFFVTAIHPRIMDESALLETAAIAESFSDHPISLSLKTAYKQEIDRSRVADIEEIPGCGVSARVDGKQVFVGNDKLMSKFGIEYRSCHHVGTIVHVALDGIYAGHIVISDQIKPDSMFAISALKKMGVRSVMLTGDREEVAKAVAFETKVDEYHAGLLPADKVTLLEEILKKEPSGKRTAFTGDGINDAPVLARADIGIAMGALGSDAAIEAADIVLMDDKVSKLPLAIRISQKTNRIVWQNIIFSLAFKFLVLGLSAFGLSNMWFAAFADAGVLVIAVLNATRALACRPKTK